MSDDKRTSHGTENTPEDTVRTQDDRTVWSSAAERFRAWRTSRARSAEENAQAVRLAKQRRDAEEDAQRNAAAQAAVASRRAAQTGRSSRSTEDIAPVPLRMRWLAVWADRTIGALPLIAPLALSGYFTTQVFHGEGQPVDIPLGVAVLAAAALEGGVWKLVGLQSRTMLEGDSTVGLRTSLFLYLGIISGLIYWHADWVAQSKGLDGALQDWGWVPAAGCALFSLLGVRIWMHNARFQYRVALRAAGRVDRQAPKFALLSWFLTPVETPKALRHAVKYRLDSPILAVEDRRLWVASGKPRVWPVPQPEDTAPAGQENTRAAATERPPVQATVRPVPVSSDRPALDSGQRPALSDVPSGAPTPASEDDVTEMENILKYAGHLLVVIKAFPDWATGQPPSVRGIRNAIHQERARQEDGGEFRSMSVASDVQKAVLRLRSYPHLVDIMNAQTATEEQ